MGEESRCSLFAFALAAIDQPEGAERCRGCADFLSSAEADSEERSLSTTSRALTRRSKPALFCTR